MFVAAIVGVLPVTLSTSDARGTGRGRSSMASTKLKIALFAPTPSATETTATATSPGCRRTVRRANRMSAVTPVNEVKCQA
jgi:hypothetical protein